MSENWWETYPLADQPAAPAKSDEWWSDFPLAVDAAAATPPRRPSDPSFDWGAPRAEPIGETTVGGHVRELAKGVPRGVGGVAAGTLQGAAVLATIRDKRFQEMLSSEIGRAEAPDQRVAAARNIRNIAARAGLSGEQEQAVYGLAAQVERGEPVGEIFAGSEGVGLLSPLTMPTERAAFEMGENFSEWLQATIGRRPGYEESLPADFGDALGSLGGFMALSMVGGPVASFGTATVLGIQDQFDRARQHMSEEEALQYAIRGGPAGAIQAASVEFILRRVPPHVRSSAGRKIRDLSEAFGAEFIVENLGMMMQNAIEQDYNPEQDLWEGVPAQGILSGSAAATLRAVVMTLARHRGPGPHGPTDAPKKPIEPEDILLSEEDEASPLPDELIREGRATAENAEDGRPNFDEISRRLDEATQRAERLRTDAEAQRDTLRGMEGQVEQLETGRPASVPEGAVPADEVLGAEEADTSLEDDAAAIAGTLRGGPVTVSTADAETGDRTTTRIDAPPGVAQATADEIARIQREASEKKAAIRAETSQAVEKIDTPPQRPQEPAQQQQAPAAVDVPAEARRRAEAAPAYAEGVVGKGGVQRVTMVGSAVEGADPNDVDMLYEFAPQDLPADSADAAEVVEGLIEGSAIDLDSYDSFIKVGDRYFAVRSGAGRDVIENTDYAREQAGKPSRVLAESVTPPAEPVTPAAPEPQQTQAPAPEPVTSAAEHVTQRPIVEPFSDKSIIVRNLSKADGERLFEGMKARPLWNAKQGGWVFSKKREAEVRERLSELLVRPAAEAPTSATIMDRPFKGETIAAGGPTIAYRDWVEKASEDDLRKMAAFGGLEGRYANSELLAREDDRQKAKASDKPKAKPTPQVPPIAETGAAAADPPAWVDMTDPFGARTERIGAKPDAEQPAAYGATNKLVTADRAAEIRERLKKKLKDAQSTTSAGIDPEIMALGTELAVFHVEAGARRFGDFVGRMTADLGMTFTELRPYLRSWYNGARDMMEDAGVDVTGMDSPDTVAAEMRRLAKEETDSGSVPEPAAAPQDDRPGDARPGAEVPAAAGEPGPVAAGDQRPVGDVSRDPGGDLEQGADRPAQEGDGTAQDDRGGQRARQPKRRAGAGDRAGVSDYRAPPGSLTREGSWAETAARNLDIVELVNKLEAEGRPATTAEQALIAKFTGWGASEIRQNLFATAGRDKDGVTRLHPSQHYRKDQWKPLVEKAATLLEGPALDNAMQSSQYAHYTSEEVIRSIWKGVERMGFPGGKILEPGMGTGLFAVAGPAEVLDGSSYTGIEFDQMTAAVAKALLPKQNVMRADYVAQKLPDGFFDMAIGNPPFARTIITDDPVYRKHRFSLHDYFFAKTVDKLRPGGLMVFVTSRYTMDKANDKARKYLAERADLLAAVRMPQTAFKQNAGTEVVTDVLFLRKRVPGEEPGGVAWQSLGEVKAGGETALVNEYFAANPSMVLGQHSLTGSMYRQNEYTVTPRDTPIEADFAKAMEALPENVYQAFSQAAASGQQQAAIERDMDVGGRKEGSLYLGADGQIMLVDQGTGIPATELRALKPKEAEWLKDYLPLRDAVKVAHKDQLTDGDWKKSLAALNKRYDAFVKKHGHIQAFSEFEREAVNEDGEAETTVYRRYKNAPLLRMDIEHPLLFALEKISEDGTISKGRFLLDRTLDKPKPPKIETAQDAMMVSLDQRGRLDIEHVAELMNADADEAITALGDSIYRTPEGDWQTSDEYLSGDVRAKLEAARVAAQADSQFNRNVDALIKAQPRPLEPHEITVPIGSGWLPADVVNDFVSEVLGVSAEPVTYDPSIGKWSVPGSQLRSRRSRSDEWGTERRSSLELMDAALNNRTIKITDTIKEGGSTRTVANPQQTQAAQQKMDKIKAAFRSWIWTDSRRAQRLTDIYNEKFNNMAPRRFDGSHLSTPGLSIKYNLHPHQKRAIWRIIQTGDTYLAHAVGAGKTLEMIVSAMEQRRLGLVRKPMFVVPNHMLEQFSGEFMDAYPAAQIMVADDKAFHTDNRRRFMAQAALNDLDAVVITHSSFGKIGTSMETRTAIVEDMIAEIESALASIGDGQETRVMRRKLEQQKETMRRRFLGKASEKDQSLSFEQLGVDMLYVDEAHEFRKLDIITELDSKGITPEGSQRALDLFIKTRWLNQQKPGRSLVFASGTPVTNTMGELYTVMRYMDNAALERDGLQSFDAWATQFGEVAASFEQNAAGQYESVARFAKFNNIPELMSRVRSFMDVLTSSQLRTLVKIPNLNTGQPQNVVIQASERLSDYMANELAPRIKTSRAWKPSKDQPGNPDPMVAIITDARIAAIDPRFFDPRSPDDPNSKLNRMVDEIGRIHSETANAEYVGEDGKPEPRKGAAQIVFSKVGFGEMVAASRGFDLRAHIARRLKDAGVKASEIAWMSDYKAHAKKQALFKEMRNGTKRILFGSPDNMGTGLNVQKRLIALHYLSPPWFPSDVEQPHGRILRQGNQNENVDIYWYATKGTYDSTAWGMVARKARFIEQAFTGDAAVRTIDDISEASQYEMASAMAAGDDRVIKLADLSGRIEQLQLLRQAHFERQRNLQRDQAWRQSDIAGQRNRISHARAAAKAIEKFKQPGLTEVDGREYAKPGESTGAIAAKLLEAMKLWQPKVSKAEQRLEIGTIGGLPINGKLESRKREGVMHIFASAWLDVGPVEVDMIKEINAETAKTMAEAPQPYPVVRALDYIRQGPDREIRDAEREIEKTRAELGKIEKQLGAPFENEAELNDKIAEKAQLQQELLGEGIEVPDNLANAERDAIEAWEGEGGSLGAMPFRARQGEAPRPPSSDPTKSPAFKRWFGKSKVVDADGKPLVLYHGTSADFDAFRPGGLNPDMSGPAIWLTDNRRAPPAAHNMEPRFPEGHPDDDYAGGRFRTGSQVMPVYARIENPLTIPREERRTAANNLGFNPAFPQVITREEIDAVQAEGHDGIILPGAEKDAASAEYIVFESGQVKSAFNRGTFDPADPRISFSRRARTDATRKEDFIEVGRMQRGRPEMAMLTVQKKLGGGVLSYAVEHVGDLTHRMNDPATFDDAGFEFVQPKVQRTLKLLRQAYGFNKEHLENVNANAAAQNIPLDQYKSQLDSALQRYADEHEKLPEYNETQRHAKLAAVALGEQSWHVAERHLSALMKVLDQGPEAWKSAAHATLDQRPLSAQFNRAAKAPAPSQPVDTAALERDLRARLDKLGLTDRVKLRVVEAIRQVVDGQTIEADGMYLRSVITVALDARDPAGVLDHEVIHALKELGVFTKLEWQALERAAKADAEMMAGARRRAEGLPLTEAQIVEEAIAEMYRTWAAGRSQIGGFMRKAFEKARDFIRAIGQALRGQGLKTAESVFQAVESGEVGRRGTPDAPAQESGLRGGIGTAATIPGVGAKAMGLFHRRTTDPTAQGGQQARQNAMFRGLNARQPIDQLFRLPFHLFGGIDSQGRWNWGHTASNKVEGIIKDAKFSEAGRFSWINGPLEKARAGLIDRHGLDPEYVERERARGLEQRVIMAKIPEIMTRLKDSGVGAAESKVLHAILTGEAVTDADMERLAEPIRDAIDDMGAEAVSLGLLSAEAFERNRGAYLHRVYLKHESDQTSLAKWASAFAGRRRKKIIGNQFKGRGLWQSVDFGRLTKDFPLESPPAVGDRFVVLDRMARPGQGDDTRQRVLKRVYLPAGEPVPDQFRRYRNSGTFEVRGTKRNGEIVLWRDFTKPERESMGEIVDARYAIAKTYMQMAHDLATGRFFRDISRNADWAQASEPTDAMWKDAGEYNRFWADPSVEWVRVPDSMIPKSQTKRYGALAGKWVRAEIWRDMAELEQMQSPNLWNRLLTQWKLNKTARNPVVHMNNVMSNIALMDLADVRLGDLVGGIRAMVKQDADYQDALNNGAFGADMVAQEIRRNVLQPLLEEIETDMRGGVGQVQATMGVVGKLADAIWSAAKGLDRRMVSLYQLEDEVFRMATYMRKRSLGVPAQQAALEARDQFLNYEIRAPWVNALRRSVLPFISYTYRAVPVVAQSVALRPWKLAKYATIAYAANALAYMITDGDDDEERRSLRDTEQGRTWIGAPRMLRMPWDDAYGNPVFLDVRRWVPAGDVFDMNQGHSAVPIPAPLQFGGPLMLAGELLLNRQAFTGEPIVNDKTDDWWDVTSKVADWAWKSWMPSAAWIPGSWYWTRIGNALKGATDFQGRPYSVPQAVSSSFGVKLKSQDVEAAMAWKGIEFGRIERELQAELGAIARREVRGMISERRAEQERRRVFKKLERLAQQAEDTFGGR